MSVERGRRWPWIVGGMCVLLGAAVVVAAVRWRDDVREVSIDDAIAEFERPGSSTEPASEPTPAGATVTTMSVQPRFTLPEPGVYRYVTTGGESIDALGGASHTYPAETAIVVRPSGCGVEVSWIPFVERRESWVACPLDGGLAIVEYGSEHEWFNTHDSRVLTCDPPAWLVPPDATVTDEVRAGDLVATCAGDGLAESRTLTHIGPTTVDVDGTAVAAVEVHVDVTTSGTTDGTSSRQLVVDAASGLPLHWVEQVANTTSTPVGDVHYLESFTLELASLTPRR